MTKQPLDDGETEKALTDYQEGMRLSDGVRAAAGMRTLHSLEGSNLELMALMFRQNQSLDRLFLYFLKFVLKNDSPKDCPLPGNASALMVALISGDAMAVTEGLSDVDMLEGDDLELLAKMLENSDHPCPYSLGFVQRRRGPPVDPLAIKARWFTIYNKFKKIPAYRETGRQKLRKELIDDALNDIRGQSDVSRSLLYEILKYFRHPRK